MTKKIEKKLKSKNKNWVSNYVELQTQLEFAKKQKQLADQYRAEKKFLGSF